jgi:hypothetical protein
LEKFGAGSDIDDRGAAWNPRPCKCLLHRSTTRLLHDTDPDTVPPLIDLGEYKVRSRKVGSHLANPPVKVLKCELSLQNTNCIHRPAHVTSFVVEGCSDGCVGSPIGEIDDDGTVRICVCSSEGGNHARETLWQTFRAAPLRACVHV